ncbi:MAG: hypothetical protein P4M12_09525 [Gammaproteobacteria bacterium]|nr:hypothetical protein [Gammaproteobacteria bacterium]
MLPENTKGRDLYVGDVQGSYSVFKKILARLQPEDRLFIVGNLVGKDAESIKVIDKVIARNAEKQSKKLPEQIYVTAANYEESFPHVILIEGANPVCMVHADMPIDFVTLIQRLENQKNSPDKEIFTPAELDYLKWASEDFPAGHALKIMPLSEGQIWDRLTICGHTKFGGNIDFESVADLKPFRENKLHLNLDVGVNETCDLLVFEPKTLKFKIFSKYPNPHRSVQYYKNKAEAQLHAFKKKKENELKAILEKRAPKKNNEIIFNENDTLYQLLRKIIYSTQFDFSLINASFKKEQNEYQIKINKLFYVLDQKKNKLLELESKIQFGGGALIEDVFIKHYESVKEKSRVRHQKKWDRFINDALEAYLSYVAVLKNNKELTLDEKLEELIKFEKLVHAEISVFKEKMAKRIESINLKILPEFKDAVDKMQQVLKEQIVGQIESLKNQYSLVLNVEPKVKTIVTALMLPREDDVNYIEELLAYKQKLHEQLHDAYKKVLIKQFNDDHKLLVQKLDAFHAFSNRKNNDYDSIKKSKRFLALDKNDKQFIRESRDKSVAAIYPSESVVYVFEQANQFFKFSCLKHEELIDAIKRQRKIISDADTLLSSINNKYAQLKSPTDYLKSFKNRDDKIIYQKYINDLAGLGGDYIQKRLKFMSQAKQDLITGFLSSVSSYSQCLQHKNVDEVDYAEKLSELVALTKNFKTVLVEHYEKDAANCFARFFYQKGYFKGTLVSLLENVLEKYEPKKAQVSVPVKRCPDYFTQVHLHR